MTCPVCGSEVQVIKWEGSAKVIEQCNDHYKIVHNDNLSKETS